MHLSVYTVHLGEVDSLQLPQESMMLYIVYVCVGEEIAFEEYSFHCLQKNSKMYIFIKMS